MLCPAHVSRTASDTLMKFIHSADWQLGKPYARFSPEVRAALTEARFDAIDTLGRLAAEQGASHVLVAGDVFDTEGPENRTIVQALHRMQRHDCQWWLLPGNHDFARNGGLWDRVRQKAGTEGSVRVLTEAVPVEMEAGVWLLPAPLQFRHNADDPTAAFDAMETPGARFRIGLAHGSICDFGAAGETQNQIPPDRAQRSGLDYLALGDWHGVLKISDRTWYAGTPETDRFQRDDPGQALVVTLEKGEAPVVTPVRTGRFQWLLRDWRADDAETFAAQCDALLRETDAPRTLLRLSLSGITDLTDQVAIHRRLNEELKDQLRYLEVRADDLVARPDEKDLEAISMEGTLGIAVMRLNALSREGGDDALLARRALERLFIEYSREEQA